MNMIRAIDHLGYSHRLVKKPLELDQIDKLIIPGVGAFKSAMDSILECELVDPVKEFANDEKPVLGICLGMQILFDRSYEFGETDGLGLLKGEIKKISGQDPDNKTTIKIPHVGWGELDFIRRGGLFTDKTPDKSAFYFVHSYMCFPAQEHSIIATSEYEGITQYCGF